MTEVLEDSNQSIPPICPASRVDLPILISFAAAVFLSAFLLFLLQPMMGKYVLPWFGGGPAVWTACMLFFQVLLLFGYLYAHLLVSGLRRIGAQALVHGGLLLAALAMLPVVPDPAWKPRPGDDAVLRIVLLLGATIGLPYLAISATGPLLQAWFAGALPRRSPYRLYALSNAGSLLALAIYPFVIEPELTRRTQAYVWSVGLAVFAFLCGGCAFLAWKRSGHAMAEPVEPPPADACPSPTIVTRVLWVMLPLCASVMLLAVTNALCLDVAAIPFLWVLPLALYLLSFILTFDHPRWYVRAIAYPGLILSVTWCILVRVDEGASLARQIAAYGTCLFAVCLVCHGEVARLRPGPAWLTSFYLSLSLGGAIGGMFVALVAPVIFNELYELYLAMALATVLGVMCGLRERPGWTVLFFGGGLLLAPVVFRNHSIDMEGSAYTPLVRHRNFYGTLTVSSITHPQGEALALLNGRICHGTQYRDAPASREPTDYYHPRSGIGLAVRLFPPDGARRVAVVGLGTGTLAAYGRRGDAYDFYEINPDVEILARRHFTYLQDSRADVRVILGDARLSFERRSDAEPRYDLIALDAFSGDAIPTHLLTREAVELYLRHLRPDGILAVHISNRHLDLYPVVARLAQEFQLDYPEISYEDQDAFASTWVLVTRNNAFLRLEDVRKAATRDPVPPNAPCWTDDHADLFSILKGKGELIRFWW